jgi:hypothetical protein
MTVSDKLPSSLDSLGLFKINCVKLSLYMPYRHRGGAEV